MAASLSYFRPRPAIASASPVKPRPMRRPSSRYPAATPRSHCSILFYPVRFRVRRDLGQDASTAPTPGPPGRPSSAGASYATAAKRSWSNHARWVNGSLTKLYRFKVRDGSYPHPAACIAAGVRQLSVRNPDTNTTGAVSVLAVLNITPGSAVAWAQETSVFQKVTGLHGPGPHRALPHQWASPKGEIPIAPTARRNSSLTDAHVGTGDLGEVLL